ncbi:hypothetical protein [Chelativorans xinjiangense]|uniref:hypothetical protein n=1 Tax=Chelativorans xinjiangense TaxID=2681485 RepID=UPI001356E1C5|nr:hypothetical protein [Chelativorans xinjiangense]
MAREGEPTLDDLLSEPIIRKVMAVDGYTPDDIRTLMRRAGAREPFVKIPKPSNSVSAPQRRPAMPIST